MIKLVISGGQTGGDLAGWKAAKACGIPTGGWMPWGFKNERGYQSDFKDLYGAQTYKGMDYQTRTQKNVSISDVTVFFGKQTQGFRLTLWSCRLASKPFIWIQSSKEYHIESGQRDLVKGLGLKADVILNVAGNRESKNPDIGVWAEKFLIDFFKAYNECNYEITMNAFSQ